MNGDILPAHMQKREYDLATLIRPLENGLFLGEALFFPEVSRLAATPVRARRALALNAAAIAAQTPLAQLHRRSPPAGVEIVNFFVTLPPPDAPPQWKEPLKLEFRAVLCRISGHEVAFVPEPGIEVLASTREALVDALPVETLAALRRMHATASLRRLILSRRSPELLLERLPVRIDIPTPREASDLSVPGRAERSVLSESADDLRTVPLRPAWCVDSLVRRVAELLGGRTPQSVLLVGPPGVGKTACMHELVRRRAELGFPETPFYATSGSRLVAGLSGFGMWQQRCEQLRVEAARQRAILHLGQLTELLYVGKGLMIQQGVAGFLRPFIARGELVCVVECTPGQVPEIERTDPHLLAAFTRIDVRQPDESACREILRRSAGPEAAGDPALETLARLHRRYAALSAWPGRPLRFLRNLLADASGRMIEPQDVFAAFSREAGLPLVILDEARPLPLAEVRHFFEQRVVEQSAAIDQILDLLATVKSGLARPDRPLASLLFVGPTGVGKTETAKALAEYLFGDCRRMARFDMSEYAGAEAVQRLIGGPAGEGLLTARIREQPFSVLLLDEFEKAHPHLLDLLLQVIGEARLTDRWGRMADFSNAVIILTSNLGANSFMRGRMGFAAAHPDPVEHFLGETRRFVRPELLNRLDRVIPFLPLSPEAMGSVLHKELQLIRRRPGIAQAGVSLSLAAEAADFLIAEAHQPELGARPLKREVERRLLAPLAEILNNAPGVALQVQADAQQGQLSLLADPRPAGSPASQRQSALDAAGNCTGLRRKAQAADRSPALQEVRNEIFRLRRLLDQHEKVKDRNSRGTGSAQTDRDRRRLPVLEQVEGAFSKLLKDLAGLEDDLVLSAAGRERGDAGSLQQRLHAAGGMWEDALLGLLRMRFAEADESTLIMECPNHDLLFDLGRAYALWATAAPAQIRGFWLTRQPSAQDLAALRRRADADGECRRALDAWRATDPGAILRIPMSDPLEFLAEPREEPGRLVLQVTGTDIALRVTPEQGRHLFKLDSGSQPVELIVSVAPGTRLDPEKVELTGAGAPVRRTYELHTRQAHDVLTDEVLAWTGSRLDTVVARGIELAFRRALEGQVGL